MAYADYRLCDVCEGKVFYDANLNYEVGKRDFTEEPIPAESVVRNAGRMMSHTRLDRLGDWSVICEECAKTHETRVVPKSPATSLDCLMPQIHEWQLQTFPSANPRSKHKHLLKEVAELGDNLSDPGEIADCFNLLLGIAMVQGIDFTAAVAEKFAALQLREWGEPDPDGVVEHVRPTPEGL